MEDVEGRQKRYGDDDHQGETKTFPGRLYKMLEEAQGNGFESIVSWRAHGRAFTILDRRKFEQDIIPRQV